MNTLFGVLEGSGEGDLRSTMSFGLGLKSSWSSLDGRVSGVKALLPLVKIAPGILLMLVGFFSPRILCTVRSRALSFFNLLHLLAPVPLEWLFLSLRPLIKFFHFFLSFPVVKPRDVVFLNSSVIRSQVEAFLATSGFS